MANIFTKPLTPDKLWQFSSMLGLQHLDVPNLRGGVESTEEAKSDKRTTRRKSAKGRTVDCRGSGMREPDPDPTEQGGDRAERGKTSGRVGARTTTWSDVVKGLEEDESKTFDSHKSRNEMEIAYSDKMGDSDELNHVKVKQTRRAKDDAKVGESSDQRALKS